MAVFTSLSKEELASILLQYNVGPLKSFMPVQDGVQNTTYIVEGVREKLVLTIYESGESEAEVIFFIHFMNHLRMNGIPCPKICKTKAGHNVVQVRGKCAVLVQFMPGEIQRHPSLGQVGMAADTLARMHVASMSFYISRSNPYGPEKWKHQYKAVTRSSHVYAQEAKEKLQDIMKQLSTFLPSLEEKKLPKGVVHLDLFPCNVFFEPTHLSAIIDLNFSATDYFLYDLAIFVNAWSFDKDHNFDHETFCHIMDKYEAVRKLTEEEKLLFPFFMKLGCLRFLLSRLEDWILQPSADLYVAKEPRDYFLRWDFHVNQLSYDSYRGNNE